MIFLRISRYNWRKLLLFCAIKVSVYFSGLTDEDREYVFVAFEKIIDDPRTFGELFLAYCDEILSANNRFFSRLQPAAI